MQGGEVSEGPGAAWAAWGCHSTALLRTLSLGSGTSTAPIPLIPVPLGSLAAETEPRSYGVQLPFPTGACLVRGSDEAPVPAAGCRYDTCTKVPFYR